MLSLADTQYKQNVSVTHISSMCSTILHLSGDFKDRGPVTRLGQTVQQHGVQIYIASVR